MDAEKDVAPDVLPDAWDYKGHPAIQASSGGWSSAAMILGKKYHFFLLYLLQLIIEEVLLKIVIRWELISCMLFHELIINLSIMYILHQSL
jgi:hypothetical protein